MPDDSTFRMRPIGIIRSPYSDPGDTPVQAARSSDVEAIVEVFPEYERGLSDLERYSHVYILYVFDRAEQAELLVKPHGGRDLRGVFATRSPRRPNPVGLSLVRLLKCEGRRLRIAGVDMLDGSPVLDIKPYVAELDSR